MDKKDIKTERIAFRTTLEFKKKLEEKAKSESRSLSNYIELVLQKHLNK